MSSERTRGEETSLSLFVVTFLSIANLPTMALRMILNLAAQCKIVTDLCVNLSCVKSTLELKSARRS